MVRIILGIALTTTAVFAADLRGTWRWTCCRGQHGGTFYITTQNDDGTFSGRFGSSSSDGKSRLTGRITNSSVRFARTILPDNQTQSWAARLSVQSGISRLVDGRWSGYMFSPGIGGFEAERIKAAAPAPPPASGPSIIGRWKWVCCNGAHSGTSSVRQQDAQGRIRGVFGNGPSDNATPFEGSYNDGQLTFTRHLTGDLQGKRQG